MTVGIADLIESQVYHLAEAPVDVRVRYRCCNVMHEVSGWIVKGLDGRYGVKSLERAVPIWLDDASDPVAHIGHDTRLIVLQSAMPARVADCSVSF